jgi:FkbM family methyltransferase
LRGAKWIVGSSSHGCWLGSYEYGKQRLFADQLGPGDVVWDIGANVGFYSLLAARLVGASGSVIAFEPLPENIEYLRRHVELNRSTNIEVLEVAVGDSVGPGSFHLGDNRSTGSLSMEDSDMSVPVITLDHLMRESQRRPPRLIKMDIEGGEVGALRGAADLLATASPIVLLATHGADRHRECVQILHSLGYTMRGIDGRSVNETDELFASRS